MNELLNMLDKTPSEAWVGLLGVIVGAALSIFGVWLINRSNIVQLRIHLEHEKNTRASTTKRDRLEELYVLVDKWLNGMFGHYLNFSLVMQGKITYDQYQNQMIEDGNKNSGDFSRLEMIVDIYGHEFESSYRELMEAREELNKVSSSYSRAFNSGDIDGKKYLEPYTNAQLKLEKLSESFKKKIAEHAKRA